MTIIQCFFRGTQWKGRCFTERNPRMQTEGLLSGDPVYKINNIYIRSRMTATYTAGKMEPELICLSKIWKRLAQVLWLRPFLTSDDLSRHIISVHIIWISLSQLLLFHHKHEAELHRDSGRAATSLHALSHMLVIKYFISLQNLEEKKRFKTSLKVPLSNTLFARGKEINMFEKKVLSFSLGQAGNS